MLFAREARRVQPPHGAVATNADIESIARASGGLPLALKLAAAWSRWLEPRSIAAQITLAASTTVGAFDGSLQAWLAPIWERLSAPQRLALASLSLSPGSFDMPAAVSLAAVSVDIIESLIDRCLVDQDPGPSPRLCLHALVRAFAGAKLRAAPVDRRVAIFRYIDGVAARMDPWPVDMGQPQLTVAQVTASLDDVLATWPKPPKTYATKTSSAPISRWSRRGWATSRPPNRGGGAPSMSALPAEIGLRFAMT